MNWNFSLSRILANAGESLSIEPSQDTMAVSICFNKYALFDLLETASVTFYANSAEDTGQKYTELKAHIQNLLMAYVCEGKASEIMEQGHSFLLVQMLLTKFVDRSKNRNETEEDSQITRIIHYIHANYKSNMSLNEIAERLFISPSWASRIFQKETGDNFTTYVKKVRLEHVRLELEQTSHPITQIAVENGFSTPSALNRIFKSEYGITPTEYRDHNKSFSVKKAQDDTRNTERLQRILTLDQKMSIADLERQLSLHVDTSQLIPWRKWENRVLNVGPADSLSSASLQKQVLFLVSTLDVEYLRIWNIFSSKMMILENNKGDYNFTFIDEILDFCVDNKLKLFIDLAQRKEVALASERQEIYSYESAAKFENASAWQDALRSFLVHIRRRYHGNTVGSWIFELTFFLNDRPYYAAETYSSISVWEQSYELIKEIIPNATIAGPGLIASPDQESMGEVIKYFLSSNTTFPIGCPIRWNAGLMGLPATSA